jgi:hypothetical protein
MDLTEVFAFLRCLNINVSCLADFADIDHPAIN